LVGEKNRGGNFTYVRGDIGAPNLSGGERFSPGGGGFREQRPSRTFLRRSFPHHRRLPSRGGPTGWRSAGPKRTKIRWRRDSKNDGARGVDWMGDVTARKVSRNKDFNFPGGGGGIVSDVSAPLESNFENKGQGERGGGRQWARRCVMGERPRRRGRIFFFFRYLGPGTGRGLRAFLAPFPRGPPPSSFFAYGGQKRVYRRPSSSRWPPTPGAEGQAAYRKRNDRFFAGGGPATAFARAADQHGGRERQERSYPRPRGGGRGPQAATRKKTRENTTKPIKSGRRTRGAFPLSSARFWVHEGVKKGGAQGGTSAAGDFGHGGWGEDCPPKPRACMGGTTLRRRAANTLSWRRSKTIPLAAWGARGEPRGGGLCAGVKKHIPADDFPAGNPFPGGGKPIFHRDCIRPGGGGWRAIFSGLREG